ncbi:MAG: hypothetical protein HFH60_03820 [Lachnospiraceae bacterium]|nr:hypothetical protein [Lachnospiraceae bacterium]
MGNRSNHRLNIEIERFINVWDSTIKGYEVKNMYENASDYESICERMDIDYEDYRED